MACYAAVASLVNLLNDILHHHRYKDLGIGRLANMESLLVKVKSLQELLRDQSSKAADDVQSKIRDVAYEAQDMIQYEIHNQMTVDTHLMPRKISEDFVEDLLKLEQLIDSLEKDMMGVKEEQTSEESEHLQFHSSNASASDPSRMGENSMIGFDKYLFTIKDELCGQSSQLQVIAIVGMGGIGKTTLTRHVFEDSLIVHHFDFRGWVTISQDYRLDRALHGLMKSLHMKELPTKDEVAQKEVIYKYLKGRRYLIVVDDIWNVEVWDDLKRIFPNDHNGSRILLTSRLATVASYCGCLGFHEIEFLSENESWNLLQQHVFANEYCPPELEEVGKLIAKKCRGLPLAIVVIAGVISEVKTRHHWKEIGRNMSTNLNGSDNEFSNILSLSYNHLPHPLKACFLYIGRFPEDYEIKISRLVNLWIAEGFIELSAASKSLEEVAEECVHDLVKRSLVLVTKRKSSGKFKFCIMHDVLRNFCKQQGLHEQFFHVESEMNQVVNFISRSVRRINVHDGNNENTGAHWRTSNISNSLRSIIWFNYYIQDYDHIFSGFILLEILDLLDKSCWIADVVFQLYHLKYLALSVKDTYFLVPPSISKLRNLQTFIIHYRRHMSQIALPNEIWEMPQLRHVIFSAMMLPAPPRVVADGGLENLQTLSGIENFKFTDDAIRMIPNLRRLKIYCSVYRADNKWNFLGLYNLVHLHQLEKLSIFFATEFDVRSFPSNFTFPLSLKELSLRSTYLAWKDLGVVGSLPNLQVLKLRDDALVGDEWEPKEGEFLHLKLLLMERLFLKHWHVDNTHFPCLEHLSIRSCDELVEIPLDIGDITTLRSIDVFGCGEGVRESVFQIREDQASMENDVQVHVH